MAAFVQSASATGASTLGLLQAPLSSTTGNTLVAIVAANIQDASWQVSSVTDTAHNTWVPGPVINTSNATEPQQVRLEVWYAINAGAVASVTATLAGVWDQHGVAARVIEASGVGALDVIHAASSDSAASLAATATTTNASDLVVAACAMADTTATLSHTSDTYTALTVVTQDGGTTNPGGCVRLGAAYKVTSSAGAQSTTWTASAARPLATCMLALKSGSVSTTNANPYWPALSTAAAFGTQPNGPSPVSAYPYDISPQAHAISFSTSQGMPYELGTTEAGEDRMALYNEDGRFDPTNTGSPYYPNVRSYVPYQRTATWSGVPYGVFTGYVERWPNSYDEALTGVSQAIGVDAWATLARVQLKSCMQEEILLDAPWAYWPLNDPSQSTYAANIATGGGSSFNLVPTAPSRATNATADFGAQTLLAGDPGTGWGQSSDDPSADAGWALGAQVTGFPSISSGGAVSFEVWAQVPLIPTKAAPTCLFALKAGTASWSSRDVVSLTVSQWGIYGSNLFINTTNSSGVTTSVDTGATAHADGRWHHYVVSFTSSSVTVWADGHMQYTSSASIATLPIDTIDVAGYQDPWQSSGIGIASFAHVAAYPAALSGARVRSHYASGHNAFPEDSGSRVNRLLTYAGWRGPRAIDTGSSVLAGCCTIAGQQTTDALNDVANWEFGLVFVDPLGRLRFRNRTSRFSQSPRATLGDGTAEAHYQADVVFDFDPTYVFNDIEVVRQGPNNQQGITQYSGDPSGTIPWEFTSTLQQGIFVLSDAQALDRATFLYSLLSVPQVRVAAITIIPSADPSLWPLALGLQIGDCVTIKRRPKGQTNTITLNVIISEVKHDVQPGVWKTTYATLPASTTTVAAAPLPWLLDDPVQSVLGTTTIPGW